MDVEPSISGPLKDSWRYKKPKGDCNDQIYRQATRQRWLVRFIIADSTMGLRATDLPVGKSINVMCRQGQILSNQGNGYLFVFRE